MVSSFFNNDVNNTPYIFFENRNFILFKSRYDIYNISIVILRVRYSYEYGVKFTLLMTIGFCVGVIWYWYDWWGECAFDDLHHEHTLLREQ